MKTVRDMTVEDLLNKYIKQLDQNGCWFACSLMCRNILDPSILINYTAEKKSFPETQTFEKYADFYREAEIEPPDLFRYGASAEIVCSYLYEMTGVQFKFQHQLIRENIFLIIKSNVALGRPVIMAIDNMHYVIAVGYDEDTKTVYYLDPLKGAVLIGATLVTIPRIDEIIY